MSVAGRHSSSSSSSALPPRQGILYPSSMVGKSRKHCFRIKAYEFNVDSKYRVNKVIGYGAYGVVAAGENVESGERIGIKKIPDVFRDLIDGKRVLREIKLLSHFHHENVISMKDVMRPLSYRKFREFYFVTELMDTDLHRVIRSRQGLSEEHVQYFVYQILRGLKYIHTGGVLHRDLKPSNILVNANCDLKICDFGLARSENADMELTAYVVTRWYRAPELLLECAEYGKAVDVWSVGCIVAELINRKPLLPGSNYLDQLSRICKVVGTPSAETIASMGGKALHYSIGQHDPKPWSEVCPSASDLACDLLEKMLKFDPAERITVEEALDHPYLAALHDPDDEPAAPEIFDWSFDKENMSEKELRRHLWECACMFHPISDPLEAEIEEPIPLVFSDS